MFILDVHIANQLCFVYCHFYWSFRNVLQIDGVCVDYLNIYDGNDVTAVTLNSEPLCGEQKTLGNMTSSGRDVTFQFVTDAKAVWRGFDLTYTVYSNGEYYSKGLTYSVIQNSSFLSSWDRYSLFSYMHKIMLSALLRNNDT